MNFICERESCTFEQTGICILDNDPAACPERKAIDESVSAVEQAVRPLDAAPTMPRFPASYALSPDDVAALMRAKYCRVIGVVGLPDAGKTAALVSLYLMLARASLSGFAFADSRTLLAFDEISRGARRWNTGQPPDQMTAHTTASDERTAGFLHLRLRDSHRSQTVDVLLPDLPGEWSRALIDSNRTDRFHFLKGVDCIWIMVDGAHLIEAGASKHAVHRTGVLMGRLAAFLYPNIPNIKLVVTRRDKGAPSPEAIRKLEEEAERIGIRLTISEIASFADGADAAPGHGISELIRSSIYTDASDSEEMWPESSDVGGGRYALRYGLGECGNE